MEKGTSETIVAELVSSRIRNTNTLIASDEVRLQQEPVDYQRRRYRRRSPSTLIVSDKVCVCSSHQIVLSSGRRPAQPVSVPILQSYNRETRVMWSQNYDTDIPHCYAVLRVDNAMLSGGIRQAMSR